MEEVNHGNKNGSKSEEEDSKEVDFDTFLSSAGEFGRYQWLLFFSTFPFYIFGGFTYFGQMFMTEAAPNHWCWIPELENLTVEERRNIAIPTDSNDRFGYSHCQAYVVNWSEVLSTGQKPNSSWPVATCVNGWEFNTSEIPYPTISSEMGWVCDRSSYQATAQSFFFVGSIVGGFIVGWIADRFGRLPAATCANMIACVAGIGSTFSRNFIEFTVCRFFVGMGYDNCMMMTYLLALEYVAPKYRTLMANLPFALFFTLGLTILPWISLACGHWKAIGLATSVPLALSLLAPFIMPESPRWLLSKGRVEDTIDKVLSVGRINKKPIPSKMVEQFIVSATKKADNTGSASVLQLLKSSVLRKMFICICLVYMCLMIIFDVSARSVGQLQFDFFLSFTLVSLTELPSLLIVSFVLDYAGRKWMMIGVCLVCCMFSLFTPFLADGLISVLCAMVVRFTINIACNATMQWSAEVLPTPVRGSGSAIIHICGYVATVISPFIAYLQVVAYYLPLTICACVAILAILLALNLPETAKQDLPQTFEDTENMIKSQPFWDFPRRKKENKESAYVNRSFELD
ncbi:carcinine transporter-like [Ostrinia furnacalis]|uniref:carcinine transporter-like n=1 Tax=Ostrinia furnacalis TaxID=93504 RepID=UPI00103ECDFC|nr:carcinine transporter-like [Ostrinia furnacalis]